ncbi:MAG: UDP-N-acetylmuramate--L-alanine ligase [Rikenella sp.]|nr:UDP-N-acetylmuramate--L-alanine ligase [Rikenella sp.]
MATRDNIYFIGIGGIGMSALARYFRHAGRQVAGYDRTPSPLTEALEAEGIAVHYEDAVEAIPEAFRDPASTCVVYTPAVPAEHSELRWFRANGFEVLKRSQMLGLLGEGRRVMAVAGTHGKTTTTTLAAHFNAAAAGEGSAFLGGISKNFGSNLVLGKGERVVVEADEFDRSFLQLRPQEAVITSIDPDHLDIYGTYEAVREAFVQFAERIVPGGTLIVKRGVELPLGRTDIRRYSYHLSDPAADFHAERLTVDSGGYYTFDLVFPDRRIEGCRLGIPGAVNVENCVAAAALVWCEGFVSDGALREAMATFRGVQRRFDFWVNEPDRPQGMIYMDDFAHHPTELRTMLTSVRKMFPNRELTIVFQPHLYTRTRDFAPEFAEVLSLADRVLLLPIYPARELPIPGVSSELILAGIESPVKKLIAQEELLAEVEALPPGGVLVTAGAGDIGRSGAAVAERVRRKNRL